MRETAMDVGPGWRLARQLPMKGSRRSVRFLTLKRRPKQANADRSSAARTHQRMVQLFGTTLQTKNRIELHVGGPARVPQGARWI